MSDSGGKNEQSAERAVADHQINDNDKRLIALLEANARESLVSLSRKLGLSRSTVQERMSRLERSGAIAGYTVRQGSGLRNSQLHAIVRFTMDPKNTPSVVDKIKAMNEVKSCYSVSGAFDLIVFISADSALRLNQILNDLGTLAGVERTTSSIVLAIEFER
jgi:DNA-binding Lrp family transcriptional regulator